MNPATATGSMSLLTQLSRVIYRRATKDVIGMGLKQLIALDHLYLNRGCLQQALGQTLMLDPNNCVILLNDLDEHGYVERRRDPADRRRHLVEITPAGVKALKEAEGKLDALEGEVLDNLSQDERAQLRDLLAKALAGHDEESLDCAPATPNAG
jgi:DNA-binding MarR family transcriptional regulator